MIHHMDGPALTPAEWAALLPEANQILGYAIADSGIGGEVGPGRGLQALAALALHDQPFGFTWADVEDEMAAAKAIEAEAAVSLRYRSDEYRDLRFLTETLPARAKRHRERADRIAALLPPRQEEPCGCVDGPGGYERFCPDHA